LSFLYYTQSSKKKRGIKNIDKEFKKQPFWLFFSKYFIKN